MIGSEGSRMPDVREVRTKLIDTFNLDGEGEVTVHQGGDQPEGQVHNISFVDQPSRFFTIYKGENGFRTFGGDSLSDDLRDAVKKAAEMQEWKKDA